MHYYGSKSFLKEVYNFYGHIPPEHIPLGYTEADCLAAIGAVQQAPEEPETYAVLAEEAPAVQYDDPYMKARIAAGFAPINTDIFYVGGAL